MNNYIFESTQFRFRELTLNDFDPFFEMQSDPKVMRYTNYHAQNNKECLDDLNKIINNYKENSNFLVWGTFNKSSEQLVGTVALIKNDKNENEIGYRLLRKYWNMGFGIEMASALCKYCFEILKISQLVAYAAPDNQGSITILEKLRFESTEEFMNHDLDCIERRYVLDQ